MKLEDNDAKRLVLIALMVTLAILTFFLIRDIFLAIFGGLLLAYIFAPVYERLLKKVTNKSLATTLILILFALIIIVPLWFIIPKIFEQIFEVFRYLQTFDIAHTIKTLFPGATDSFVAQMTAVFSTITSKFASSAMNGILNTFFQLPTLALNVLVAGFVFFFALRDKDKLRDFVEGLSPLSKAKEGLFIQQFKDITDAIVYGQVVIGVIQGTLAGLSFFIFGVPNAFVLTILAIVFAIIPMVGPMVVWIPVTFYLFATAPPWVVILYLLYNIIIVSTIDNVVRSYIISKKSRISTAVIIVGMVGGFLLLGFLGLIIGPLIVAYLVIFLEAYKDKKWTNLFVEE